jgi:hypothetical protein
MTSTVQGGRRRLDASVPPEYDVPTREPRIESQRTVRFILGAMMVLWLVGVLAAASTLHGRGHDLR